MDQITPFDWERLFIGVEPPLFFLEIVFRIVMIYGFAVLALRLTRKVGYAYLEITGNLGVIGEGDLEKAAKSTRPEETSSDE